MNTFLCDVPFLGKSNYHLSSKKPLFIANAEQHRKPQLYTIQRSAVCGKPSCNGYTYSIAHASVP